MFYYQQPDSLVNKILIVSPEQSTIRWRLIVLIKDFCTQGRSRLDDRLLLFLLKHILFFVSALIYIHDTYRRLSI